MLTDIDEGNCNVSGPKGYHCTELVTWKAGEKQRHAGRHAAHSIVGTLRKTEIVNWIDASEPTWNLEYRGR